MAVTELLKPTTGTWRVVLARWLLYTLAILPGMLSMSSHLDATVGTKPWFHDLQTPLDLLSLKYLIPQLSGGVSMLMAGVFIIWLLQLVWLGGAMRVLDPNAPGVQKKVFANGWQYLARFIRIAIFAVLAVMILRFVIGKVFAALSARAEVNTWSVYDAYITLNVWHVLVLFFAMTIVGVVAFLARSMAVAHERRDTRRLLWPALKLMVQKPGSVFAAQFLLVCAVLGIQAMALICWRQSGNDAMWFGLWALLQLATAYVWQIRIRLALSAVSHS